MCVQNLYNKDNLTVNAVWVCGVHRTIIKKYNNIPHLSLKCPVCKNTYTITAYQKHQIPLKAKVHVARS